MSREVQGAVTQFFFDTDVYFRFVENCKKLGCDKPITAGIMPISNKDALIRMANNCGAKLPDSLIKQLDSYSEEEDIKKFGIDYVSSLVQELIKKGAPGIHFYTINQLEPTKLILDNLD
jgi:methylenetetrahydrofolate reductase (NADPH)